MKNNRASVTQDVTSWTKQSFKFETSCLILKFWSWVLINLLLYVKRNKIPARFLAPQTLVILSMLILFLDHRFLLEISIMGYYLWIVIAKCVIYIHFRIWPRTLKNNYNHYLLIWVCSLSLNFWFWFETYWRFSQRLSPQSAYLYQCSTSLQTRQKWSGRKALANVSFHGP